MAEVDTQDVASVGSRVSWGAIFAGAFVALTLCVFLGVLGVALNLSVANTDVRGDQLATGAGIWTIVSLLVALFLGGFVTSRTTVGEKKGEALMYGVLVWAVLIAMMVGFGAVGANTDYGLGGYLRQAGTTMTQPRGQQANAEATQKGNLNAQQAAKLNEGAEASRQAAHDMSATSRAWWAFAGIGLSLFAAMLGALVGAGPELVLRHWSGRRLVASPRPH